MLDSNVNTLKPSYTPFTNEINAAHLVASVLAALGVRDTARRARVELDQVVQAWIVLVVQQVSAEANPSTAMLMYPLFATLTGDGIGGF